MTQPGPPYGPQNWPPPADPFAPVDYPANFPDPPAGYPPLPPPVYPPPASSHPGARPGPWPPSGSPPIYPPLPPAVFPDPYDPYNTYGRGALPGTNGKAIASLVCGVASLMLCMCFVPSLAAIILGVIGLSETRRTGQAGRGLAIGGLVLGGVTMILGLLLVVVNAGNS